MLKEKLAEIKAAEKDAAALIESARSGSEQRLHDAARRAAEIAREAQIRAEQTIAERVAEAQPGINSSTARTEEANHTNIAELRVHAAERSDKAVDLVIGYVKKGLDD